MNIFAKYLIFRQKHKIIHDLTNKTFCMITLTMPHCQQSFITLLFFNYQKQV